MQTKRVKCPHCGVVLDVKNSKNETLKQITCPQCKYPLQVKFDPAEEQPEPPSDPLEAETYYAPKKAVDAATQLGGISSATQLASTPRKNKKAILTFQGEDYLLSEGQNIIGRSGTTSKASIQIKTDDRYMSRQHVAIEVKTFADGTIKAVLQNYKNKNETLIDGQAIETGDEIRLADNNTITMGRTTVTFKIS